MDTKREAIITEYKYTYFGKEQIVYVEKGKEHPDPSKLLTWGRDVNGEVIKGNYNRFFVKAGKPIKVPYDISGCRTATEETMRKIDAIKATIKTFSALDKAAEKFDSLMDLANGDAE
jgi:hypothetical protein